MRVKRYLMIAVTLSMFALGLGACSSKEEFLDTRAYRDVSELDHSKPHYTEFITDGYRMSEDDRKRILEAYEIVNTIRKDEGLEPLKWDVDLETCAMIRAEEIVASFAHTRPDGEEWYTVYPGMLLGENICKGSEHADMVMESWMKNQPDRDNFLCDGFTKAAMALYRDDKGQCFWTCEFGNESSVRY